MRDPAVPARLDPPLTRRLAAHRFTNAELVAIDVATVVAVTVIFGVFMPAHSPTLSGTAWDTAGWAAYVVASVAILFRRRLPRCVLAIVLPAAVLSLCLQRGGSATIYVAMALYSVVVVVSSRRAGLVITGLVAGAVLAATIAGGGAMVILSSNGGVVLVLLGWLAAENTRASRMYAAQQAERAAEQAAAAEAEQAAQVRRAMADERAQIARELHDIVAHAMSVIAVRSGVARMVIDTDPEPGPRGPRHHRDHHPPVAARDAPAGRGPARRPGSAGGADPASWPGRPGSPGRRLRGGRGNRRRGRGRGGPPAAGRRGPVRVPHRAGGADQRGPARRANGAPASGSATSRTR